VRISLIIWRAGYRLAQTLGYQESETRALDDYPWYGYLSLLNANLQLGLDLLASYGGCLAHHLAFRCSSRLDLERLTFLSPDARNTFNPTQTVYPS
jgi:hypothetical protein